jgi:amidase
MLENQSVEEIIQNIQSSQLSIKELMEYYLDRIEKYNADLNAIILLKDKETLISEAVKKDNLKETHKPLNGIPIAIKDLSDVVGLRTTYGFPGTKNYLPQKNSLFVDRLIKSGAIIIGKTNTAELGVGGHTINRLFGPTSNCYDFSKSAAGSSGGASTAVAAGLLPFADGTDQMGSCRGPAAYANIYGYRPTPGLISVDRGKDRKIPVLTTPGCLAKSPNDMAFLLDEMVGSDIKDNYSFNLNGAFKNQQLDEKDFINIKIGWLSNMSSNYKIENKILDICEIQLKKLEDLNIKIEKLKPDFDHDALWSSWIVFRSKSIYEDTLAMNIKDINTMTYQAIWEYNNGKNISDKDLQIAKDQKNKCYEQIENIFKNFDFLALPSAQIFPFDKTLQFPKKINSLELDTYHRWLEIFILSSLLELPTITVPVGFDEKGMPMGMQIIGKNKSDLKLFAFVKKYEEIFNFSKFKPLLD